ncbi:MAG: 2-octaprenyl-3-methyl-6-methoxy-1,4-benzoquinol hydroxylase [Candidatus Erwinia impunctatus]|nr:2-octaprenyl-3-methyl-6-methoxy-1,4-benzoquinol hydroxylase [Culicoides impunctatus]
MTQPVSEYDIAIVGGGMVGAALASGLAARQFSVALLDKQRAPVFDPQSPYDLRISAIGLSSVRLLQQLGAWSDAEAMRCWPYRRLETWEEPGSTVSFDATALGLSELGYMVENNVIQRALWQQLNQQPVTIITPASLRQMHYTGEGWQLTLENGDTLFARLVVGADGAASRVRQLAGIGIHGWQYAQSCMLISAVLEKEAGECTWQQFTPQGPRALLPLAGNHASLVWYDHPARIRQLQSLSMPQLAREIHHHFPERIGQVTPLQAGGFALTRRHARRYVLPGLALVGDAAHTINPLAGQGVNLGYRDVSALLDTLTTARDNGQTWYSEEVLQRYQHRRWRDNQLMQSSMDLFHFSFSHSFPPLRIARNIALRLAENAGPLKKQALRYALGL